MPLTCAPAVRSRHLVVHITCSRGALRFLIHFSGSCIQAARWKMQAALSYSFFHPMSTGVHRLAAHVVVHEIRLTFALCTCSGAQ